MADSEKCVQTRYDWRSVSSTTQEILGLFSGHNARSQSQKYITKKIAKIADRILLINCFEPMCGTVLGTSRRGEMCREAFWRGNERRYRRTLLPMARRSIQYTQLRYFYGAQLKHYCFPSMQVKNISVAR